MLQEPLYDPPYFSVAQMKSDAMIRTAWKAILSDVQDSKHLESFIYWLPTFLPRVYQDVMKKEGAVGVAVPVAAAAAVAAAVVAVAVAVRAVAAAERL